jgi:hypothetical protein
MTDRLEHLDDKVLEQSGCTRAVLLPAQEGRELDGKLAEVEAQLREYEAYQKRLSADIAMQTFGEVMDLAESITKAAARLRGHANLWFADNAQCQQALAFPGRMD